MAGDEPPYLPVGTDVSAKYRGAFCEAKVKKIVKSVKCKVALKDLSGSIVVTDDNVKGALKIGVTVEVKHPESGLFVEGIINKLTDCSMYTVVFDDADERTLRRTQICLKGEKHFIESETLDNLPLSHPEHFGTPVMQSSKDKKKRRSLRDNEEDESELSSAESETVLPKRASYKGKNQDLVGKVMYIEIGDKKKLTAIPVLVVLPDAHSTELRTKDHLLVRSFRDSKYLSVSRRELKEFVRDVALKNEDKAMKNAMEKALLYFDSGEVPGAWNKEELLGYESEVDEGDGEDSSDDEPSEEKDRFVAQLYKFMDDRGTPINKAPTIGSKDLNLYKLFKVVQNIGGYNRVTSMMRWRLVYSKMSLPQSNAASSQIKNAYKKYLHAFEDFYRKLGSTMGTISRPGRSRQHPGRSMYRDNQRKTANDIILSPKERKTPVKEVKAKDSERRNKDTPEQTRSSSDPDCDLDSVKKELAETFKLEEQALPRKEDKTSDKKEDTPSREKRDLRETRERKSAVKDEEEDKKTEEKKIEEKKIEEKKEAVEDSVKNTRKRMRTIAALGRKSPRGDDVGKRDEDKVEDSGESGKKEDKKEERKEEKKEEKKETVEKKENRRKPKEKEIKPKVEPEKEEVEVLVEKICDMEEEESILPSATKLKVKYGRGRNQKIYEAKVVEASTEDGPLQYLVHYAGWNNRYDEWVRPERIVQIVDKPESSRKSLTKAKPSTPQSPKGPAQNNSSTALKKRGRPSSITPTRSSGNDVKTSNSETRSHSSRSPAPSGPAKSRPTRSNSLETPTTGLLHKPRRTRRSSGYTDSTDLQSHASESESDLSFEERCQDEDDPADFTETVVKTDVEEEKLSAPQPSSPKPTTAANKTPNKPEVKSEEHDVSDIVLEKEQPVNCDEKSKVEDTKAKKVTPSVKDKEDLPVFSPIIVQSSNQPIKEKQSQIISALVSTPIEKVSDMFPSDSVFVQKSVKPISNQVCAPIREKSLPLPEPLVSEKAADVKPPVLADTKTESGSDEESFSKVPEIVKEGDTKLLRAEVLEFEKPPTLVKAISLTDNKDNQESKESKQRKKTKEGKRGRPPTIPQNNPIETTDHIEAVPVSQEKVVEKRPREESVSAERHTEVSVKKERKEETEEKCSEEKVGSQETHPKEENEKKKVKKKTKKKHHEGKTNLTSDLPDGESTKKEGTVKKPKDGSKKLSKGDKLSKKEKKALKKKNKLKEKSGEKLKEDDSSNDSLMKLVADVLNASQALSARPSDTLPLPQIITTPASTEPVPSTSSFHSATCIVDSKDSTSTSDVIHKPVIPVQPQAQEPPQNDPQPTASSILTENTPPTTPEHESVDVRVEPPDNLQLSIDRAVSRTMAEAGLANVASLEKQSAGGESPCGGDGSTTSNESGSSGNLPSSESSSNDLITGAAKRKRDPDDGTPSKKKKRSSKRQEKKQAAKAAGSDSEEAVMDNKEIITDQLPVLSPTQTATTTTTTPTLQQRSPRPSKYNFNLEEGKYLEGEKRITFLVEKISEVRKIYMSLKAEVACIDRRRKRHKRKERESESV